MLPRGHLRASPWINVGSPYVDVANPPEKPMQPLSDYDLVLNIFVAVVMPLLILVNLMNWGASSAMSTYLWREHPGLMKVSLVVIGLISLYSMVQLAVHYGLILSLIHISEP